MGHFTSCFKTVALPGLWHDHHHHYIDAIAIIIMSNMHTSITGEELVLCVAHVEGNQIKP